MSSSYNDILAFGQKFSTGLYVDPKKILKELETFSHEWKQYNPRKKVGREGLSLFSLDGGFSGIPDLDSIGEYCIKHNVRLNEMSFSEPTEAAEIFSTYTEPFTGYIGRSHVIRMDGGGYFPPHRDMRSQAIDSFRLFLPLKNCNPPRTWFMLDREPLVFEHGRLYFINTAIEHTVFSCYPSVFGVFNIEVNRKTIQSLIQNIEWR